MNTLSEGINPYSDKTLLDDLQANILKHHGREYAYHLFFKIQGNKSKIARVGLSNLVGKVTTAYKQLVDAKKREDDSKYDGGVVVTVSLSKTGYDKLNAKLPCDGLPDSSNQAFLNGMKSRKKILSDDLKTWENGFQEDIDLLVIVADSSETLAIDAKNRIIYELKEFTTLLVEQRGVVLRNDHGLGIEHFGYVDGVSQPLYLQAELAAQKSRKHWTDEGNLKNLLVFDNNKPIGSYFVFRKLEQDVKNFKAKEADLTPVKDSKNIANPELAGAMIVGRFEDGTEVINFSEEKKITSESQLNNDFIYAQASTASKCPFHAHIRVTNPRDDVSEEFAKEKRITRRGIPYNDIGRNPKDLEEDQPTEGVGLLFMCYQSDIENQFEFIQQKWANEGNIGGNLVGIDGVIGQGVNGTSKSLPKKWGDGNPNENKITFERFVKMKGGEYFFTPTIKFLKDLKLMNFFAAVVK
jgi:Dyp-type peroxidase family